MHDVTVRVCPVCPFRRAVASRVAGELGRRGDVRVTIEPGSLGELSASVDGRPAFHSRGILWSPRTERVLRHVEDFLASSAEAEERRT